MSKDNLKIVFFGVGAVGGSVGGWIAQRHEDVYFLARGKTSDALKEKGLVLYKKNEENRKKTIDVKVIEDLVDVPDVDVVVLGVKNYSLDEAAKGIKEKVGDRPIIVSMANGIENQRVLPEYFSKVIYCVVNYNAWTDEPGVFGYQRKGPLVFGTLNNELQSEMGEVARIFNMGVETIITDRLQDAAHCKLVLNLNNSLLTLIGFKYSEVSDIKMFQKLLTSLTYEGIQVIMAAGYCEFKLRSLPSWKMLTLAVKLPQALTSPMFQRNLKNMGLNSMAQDVLQKGRSETELESLNGYILELAERHGKDAPYNRAIYGLAKKEFLKPDFKPLDVKDVWEKVKENL